MSDTAPLAELDDFSPPPAGSVLTIGNFDGVHRGHAAIIREVCAIARSLGAAALAVTFDPHPLAVLAPERLSPPLTTLTERAALLSQIGVEHVLTLDSRRGVLSMAAAEFLEHLAAACRPRVIVEGHDFHFGKGREGSVETLRTAGARLGFEVRSPEPVRANELADQPLVSSSAIRAALRAGDAETAAAMLGRRYRIRGVVETGDARGRILGYPTANVGGVANLLPREGVYACIAEQDEGARHAAAVNVGPQPTFGQLGSRVEAHLLDFSGDLVGRPLALEFLERIRGQQQFASVEELVKQIARDCAAARAAAARAAREDAR